MTRPVLADAFEHHVWATLRILDASAALDDAQLATIVPGTYGSIVETLRHLVGADRWYLFCLSDGALDEIEEAAMGVPQLRAAMEVTGPAWQRVLATNPDPEADFVVTRADGSQSHATWGVRLAQVVHHGTDHRSQVATALTALGIEPPGIDLWDWALTTGRHWES